MPIRSKPLLIVAAAECRSAFAGRLVQAFAALFAILAVAIALAGLSASGQLVVQGFTRTAVSLITLALYFLPLVGLVLGAHAFGSEDGGTELLLAQPIGRTTALLGRTLGLMASLVIISLVGFGLAGLIVAASAGTSGLLGYVLVALGSTVVGCAGLAFGVCLGVVARRRAAAIGAALIAWVMLAVLLDFAAIALLQFIGDGEPGALLLALLAINPIDGMRALALVGLGADVLLGPTGSALARLVAPSRGGLLVVSAMLAWCVIPLWWAARAYQRRDF